MDKEMPMTEAIAYISGQFRNAYKISLISGISTFLLIAIYKSKKIKI